MGGGGVSSIPPFVEGVGTKYVGTGRVNLSSVLSIKCEMEENWVFEFTLRSGVRIEMQPTENDSTQLYKNGDQSQLLLHVATSNLVGRKSKWYFVIKFSLLLSIVLCSGEK